ncbi:uncharacterized protein [Diadema antillarum]|uniref:uncharacterized protein n=1 Tax=Diadema antillarum TaxID=105358 RepID=UPI003A868CD1
MDRRYDLTLLLTLAVTLFCSQIGHAFVVGTAPTVRGWKGENIRLRCDIQEDPRIVYWNDELREPVATFNDGTYESRKERFNMENDFSLVITDLRVADEGLYYCEVALGDQQTSKNTTIVTISSMASRHTIEECADRSQSRLSRCTYQSPSNTPPSNLTCVVSGFKPNVSMLWTEESGKRLNSVVSQQNTLSDGTYERFETITVSAKHGTEQTFMCVATGDSLNGTSTREITILPIHVSGKRAHLAFIIGLAIGLPAALIIVFLLVGKYLQNKHPDYLPRKGCGWNPCWRRPNKPERFDEEEGLPLRSSSLTKEQIQQCKEELKEYYCLSRGKVTVDPFKFKERVELDAIYTNLSIIDRTRKGNTKTPITYGDLMTNDEHGHLSKRLLIQGEGGVGKTTLCAKIAWDWCQGRIFQDLDMYDKVKSECLSRRQEFRYLLYFTSALGNELGLDIIQDLIDSAPHFVMDYTPEADRMRSDDRRCRDFCVDVAFECHTEEAARAVGKRWKEYELSSDVPEYEHTDSMLEYQTEEGARAVGKRRKKYELSSYSPEHTNSGVAFMVRFNQVPSLNIASVKCGRTVSRDLAEGMCSRSVLSKVSISNSRFHTDFYNILGAEASNCQFPLNSRYLSIILSGM